MSASTVAPSHSAPDSYAAFKLIRQLAPDIFLAQRNSASIPSNPSDTFIAQRLTAFASLFHPARPESNNARAPHTPTDQATADIDGLLRLLFHQNFQRGLLQILNHENLISIAGELRQQPLSTPTELSIAVDANNLEHFLVWDDCNAGTLQQQFDSRAFSFDPQEGFMPESLCWHVLVSVLRALAWLHDGYRRDAVHELKREAAGEVHTTVVGHKLDGDWNPILHRAIVAKNVYFQHPQGTETYGTCKLGGFDKVFVSGHVVGDEDRGLGSASGWAIAPRGEAWATAVQLRKGMRDPVRTEESLRPYTIAHEHYALGALIYKMMRGDHFSEIGIVPDLPSGDVCGEGGCNCVHAIICPLEDEPCVLVRAREKHGCRCTYGGCEHTSRVGSCDHTKIALRDVQTAYEQGREAGSTGAVDERQDDKTAEQPMDAEGDIDLTGTVRFGGSIERESGQSLPMASKSSNRNRKQGRLRTPQQLDGDNMPQQQQQDLGLPDSCWHDCRYRGHPPFNIDDSLIQLPYSLALRKSVRRLLSSAQIDNAVASCVSVPAGTKGTLLFVEEQYRWWRTHTEEGDDYVDVDDDVKERWRRGEEKRLREERIRSGEEKVVVVGEPVALANNALTGTDE